MRFYSHKHENTLMRFNVEYLILMHMNCFLQMKHLSLTDVNQVNVGIEIKMCSLS